MNGPIKEDKLSLFSASVFGVKVLFELAKTSLSSYKEKFYRWFERTGIRVDNCPQRLKLVLYALNEVLEGRGEKLEHDIENKKPELDPDSPEYQKWVEYAFSEAVKNLGVERTWEEFEGDTEKGKESFQEILATVSPEDYANFYWCLQKEEIPTDDSPVAETACQVLKELLNKAEQVKDDRQTISEIIQQLEQFRDNQEAHKGKNNYAWRKLNGTDKLASLRIRLKFKDLWEQNPPRSKDSNNNSKFWIVGIFSSVILLVAIVGIIIAVMKKKKKQSE